MKAKGSYLTKLVICISIFLFVNILFCVKYISRYTDLYFLFTFLDIVILLVLISSAKKLSRINPRYLTLFNVILILIYGSVSLFLFKKIPVETLNVDRWSVITSFWENFERDEFVYYAKSNVGNPPGPMPFYFVLAYPFYKIQELGFYSLLGLPVFLLTLQYNRIKTYLITIILLLLLSSPFMWWEVMCRSNILINGSLVLFSVSYFFNNKKNITTQRLIISAILFGLLLSTRSVFSIAFIIACMYAIKSQYISLAQLLQLSIVSCITFILTFIPFVYRFFDDFQNANPFIIQSTFLMPFFYTFLFLAAAFILGLICKSKIDVYFYISVTLFLCILTYFMYMVGKIGLETTIFGRIADISYFIFSMPFALFYICSYYNNSVNYDSKSKNSRCITGI